MNSGTQGLATIRSLIAASVMLMTPGALWANAGGYNAPEGVNASGTLGGFEPSQLEAVRIMDEQLTIDLWEDGADVSVRYIMRNETDRQIKVRFGFPIDENAEFGVSGPPTSAGSYRATADGKSLGADFVAEDWVEGMADVRRAGLMGWMISETVFGPRAEVTLAIDFHQPFAFRYTDAGPTHRSEKIFGYRLSTGAAWAGTIARGRVELRPREMDPDDIEVLEPAGRFERVGDNQVWRFENLEPTLDDDLVVRVAPDALTEISGWFDERNGRAVDRETSLRAVVERIGDRWVARHRGFKASASSEKAPYAAANIGKDDAHGDDKVWAEDASGAGEGEWLELRPNVPRPLTAILFRPGFAASDASFAAHARPKRIRVELNGEHSFTAPIPDRNGPRRLNIDGYNKPIESVKLVFEEVWRGSEHEDLCVSDVQLEVALPGESKLKGKGDE